MSKTFSIYRSSAGSGKTRTLAKEYLKLALQFRSQYFRHILAVTFTNKASQEMKDRILFYLDEFAKGRDNELAAELKQELQVDDLTFQQHSQEAQSALLHHYSNFSISTIDAFFQKVIRSFTRESGLVGDYRLEVDQDEILEQVINNLIDELGNNKELTDWLVDFAKENLENERAWDVRFSLIEFAREIFREEFKAIEDDVIRSTAQKGFFKNLKSSLWAIKKNFLQNTSAPATEALAIIDLHGWSVDDFKHGRNSGLITFFQAFASAKDVSKIKVSTKRIRSTFLDAEQWPGKIAQPAQMIAVARQKLIPLLSTILNHFDSDFRKALSAEIAIKNLYVFGLIADISRKLREYKDENNLMLLADAPKFLNGIIQDSDTPFIYEKVGSFFKNYLIDEFQDTSGMQWKNFQPLILNSLDQGYKSMVVGDVKQAIYRWRGGDLNLLQNEIARQIGEQRVEVRELDQNFRSPKTIVQFNNEVFKSAAQILALTADTGLSAEVYKDVAQQPFAREDGFVKIEFISEEKPLDTDHELATGWKDVALEKIPVYLEVLQAQGVPLRDIAILVRKNDEGQRVAAHLLEYKNSPEAKPGCSYDIISNESLRIDGAASVNLLLGAMKYLLNPDNAIARAQLAYEYARVFEPSRALADVFTVTNQYYFESNLPPAFTREKTTLKKLPLLDLNETLIEIFNLGSITGELTYLHAFQDLVLEFTARERNDLGAFLEWWEDNKHKKSIQVSGEVNAAQIITIHKSKGLQFPYVIIPFCSWGLDHDNWQSPTLWVRSEEPSFRNFGYLPVRYSKMLEETFFDSAYREEKTRSYLDNLNILYVAFTRAKKGMIVTAPSPETRGARESVASLLWQCLENNETLAKNFDQTAQVWKSGELNKHTSDRPLSSEGISLTRYHSSNWREKLVIKKSAAEFFEHPHQEKRAKINYGIQMHSILSRLKRADDLEQTVLRCQSEGLIAEESFGLIIQDLRELLAIPQVKSWFSTTWEVRTEIPVILPGGNENRIDRLLINGQQAIVIDFKTGAAKKSDNEQVLHYLDILRKMNFIDTKGFLLYLKEKSVVEVKLEGKQRLVKKPVSKEQLGFDF